jgi:hypothetical protein
MMKQLDTFHGNVPLVEALARHGVRFLVVGGLAVHHHAPERQADDLDLLVDQTVEIARKLMDAFASINLRPNFSEEQFVNGRKVQIPLKSFNYADIITAGPGFDFDEHWQQADEALIGNTRVKVASIPTLLVLLAGSDNPKHAGDVELLRRALAAR